MRNTSADKVLRMLNAGGSWYGAGEEYIRERINEWIPVIEREAYEIGYREGESSSEADEWFR